MAQCPRCASLAPSSWARGAQALLVSGPELSTFDSGDWGHLFLCGHLQLHETHVQWESTKDKAQLGGSSSARPPGRRKPQWHYACLDGRTPPGLGLANLTELFISEIAGVVYVRERDQCLGLLTVLDAAFQSEFSAGVTCITHQ